MFATTDSHWSSWGEIEARKLPSTRATQDSQWHSIWAPSWSAKDLWGKLYLDQPYFTDNLPLFTGAWAATLTFSWSLRLKMCNAQPRHMYMYPSKPETQRLILWLVADLKEWAGAAEATVWVYSSQLLLSVSSRRFHLEAYTGRRTATIRVSEYSGLC